MAKKTYQEKKKRLENKPVDSLNELERAMLLRLKNSQEQKMQNLSNNQILGRRSVLRKLGKSVNDIYGLGITEEDEEE